MSDPVCWCSSDVKCPHAVTNKIPAMWDELEKVIDDVLQQFDRKAIRSYLKRDVDGNNKSNGEAFCASTPLLPLSAINGDNAKKMRGVKSAPSDNASQISFEQPQNYPQLNPLTKMRVRPDVGRSNKSTKPNLSRSVDFPDGFSQGGSVFDNNTDPLGFGDGMRELNGNRPATSSIPMSPISSSHVNRVRDISHSAGGNVGSLNGNSERDMMSKSMPVSFGVVVEEDEYSSKDRRSKGNRPAASAWGQSEVPDMQSVAASQQTRATTGTTHTGVLGTSALAGPDVNYNITLPDSSAISVGLLRIADIMARKVLPWQAVACPRAVENFRDIRAGIIKAKHENFILKMTSQLEDKILGFIMKKDEEVDVWISREIEMWQKAMNNEDNVQTDFFRGDEQRLSRRAAQQEDAYRFRELSLTSNVDDQERDATRDQLVNFRKLCRSENKSDVRALHASIEGARAQATAQSTVTQRDCLRRQEQAHDWLCCIADNAVTAQESEVVLKTMNTNLVDEKTRAKESLEASLVAYNDQNASVLEGITAFHARVHAHAHDYLRRELMVSRAFIQYLSGVISGEIKPHASDHRKTNVAWEGKFACDRAHKKDAFMTKDFNAMLIPFDKIVNELRDRIKAQASQVTMKMNSVLHGRDNDIDRRKAAIHRRLAKHVKKLCNGRRIRLKDADSARGDEFLLEEQCVSLISALTAEIRGSVDQIWVKEHIKERRMYEAAAGRMTRLEKSSLLIWDRHAHKAQTEHEDYQEWYDNFVVVRDKKVRESRIVIHNDWKAWRKVFGAAARAMSGILQAPIGRFVRSAQDLDVRVTVEQNKQELSKRLGVAMGRLKDVVEVSLYDILEQYINVENEKSSGLYQERRDELVLDWQTNLHRLNNAINRRVSSLKGMEKDLEETIRVTLAQNEIEASVFEQGSCARFEQFWIGWRDQVSVLGVQLKESLDDFRIARSIGRNKSRSTAKDRALEDLVMNGPENIHPVIPKNNSTAAPLGELKTLRMHLASGPHLMQDEEDSPHMPDTAPRSPMPTGEQSAAPVEDSSISDTSRLKAILDEIRQDAYTDFFRYCTRHVELIRKQFGDGRRRSVPPFMIARVLLAAADAFYERAKMSERCAGRVASRGMRLFMTGMPKHGRALFCLGTALTIISSIPTDDHRIDPDVVMEFLKQGLKRVFLCALLTVTNQLGGYGEYMLTAETTWVCATCGVTPDRPSTSENIDYNNMAPDIDPVDAMNSLLSIPESPTERDMKKSYDAGGLPTPSPEDVEEKPGRKRRGKSDKKESAAVLAQKEAQRVKEESLDIGEYLSVPDLLARLSSVLPAADTSILLSLLGRHGNIVEITFGRFVQAVHIWRRVALAIVTAVVDPPGPEYSRVSDLMSQHLVNKAGKRKVGYADVSCVSPFEAVTITIDWFTSIVGIPVSVLQALCIITRSGSCDPWMEDPKQSSRSVRFTYEVTELLDSFACRDYDLSNDVSGEEPAFQAAFQTDIEEKIKVYDVNQSGTVPLELLRSFIKREDADLTNTQVTSVYWCICRCTGEAEELLTNGLKTGSIVKHNKSNRSKGPLPDKYALDSVDGPTQHLINPEFFGDVGTYLNRFSDNLDEAIDTVPELDTTVVLGLLPAPLNPQDSHQIVNEAMKLDVSAHNNIPNSCCVWMGLRLLPLSTAIATVTVSADEPIIPVGQEGEDDEVEAPRKYIGPGSLFALEESYQGPSSPSIRQTINNNPVKLNLLLLEMRMRLEIDVLTKYPVICERRASDMCYGAGGGDSIDKEDHFAELTKRRLDRLDQLSISWRNTMMNEWSTSLYQSRQKRYAERAEVVRECIRVYRKQYEVLKESIIDERELLLKNYTSLCEDIADFEQADEATLHFHTSFLVECMDYIRHKTYEYMDIMYKLLQDFQDHCGTIKRSAVTRVNNARDQMKADLELSCQGLIEGYSIGYAQKHFDELMFRGERWRMNFTTFHGKVIVDKEKFVINKLAMDGEIINQITDRITVDRNRTKKLLDRLTTESMFFHESVATVKVNYAELQKDANQRIMLRVDRCMRECKKLRGAGEKDVSLEEVVLKQINGVLTEAMNACYGIVNNIKDASEQQLATIEPRRSVHRGRMEDRIREAHKGWLDLEKILVPLSENYVSSVKHQMFSLKARSVGKINVYENEERALLNQEYVSERKLLIDSFRGHFTEYDLSESQIFERYNLEVDAAVKDIRSTWGLNKPLFMTQAMDQFHSMGPQFLTTMSNKVRNTMHDHVDGEDDDVILARIEVVDMFALSLHQIVDIADELPDMFLDEKKQQMLLVKNMGLKNNSDMVRPQVVAIMDLLLSGIEIDNDLKLGYQSLQTATTTKAREIIGEIDGFITLYLDPNEKNSITHSAQLVDDHIDQRRNEIETMVSASQSHLVADHSKLDVEISAGYGDIEEWTNLTNQLIKGAFDSARDNYMSSIFPTPPASPRVPAMPTEKDRVGKIKAMLMANYEANLSDEEPEPEVVVEDFRNPSQMRELQEGWLECCTEDHVIYYFHPESGESLWDLPNALKVPKIPIADRTGDGYLDTPRSLILGDGEAIQPHAPATLPDKFADHNPGYSHAINKHLFRGDIDVGMVVTDVMGYATNICENSMLVALEVVDGLHNKHKKWIDREDETPSMDDKGDAEIQDFLAQLVGADNFTQFKIGQAEEKAGVKTHSAKAPVSDIVVLHQRVIDEAMPPVEAELDINSREWLRVGMAAEGEPPADLTEEEYVESDLLLKSQVEADLIDAIAQEDEMLLEGNNTGEGLDSWLALHFHPEDLMSYDERQTPEFALKEVLYRIVRENDTMRGEDHAGFDLREEYQRELRAVFKEALSAVVYLNDNDITAGHVEELKIVGANLRQTFMQSVFREEKTTWAHLHDRVAAAVVAQQLAKEKEEAQRKKTLEEHEEDFDEMFQFFRSTVGLSKVVSRRAATEAIVLHISTARKLSRSWQKKKTNLERDLKLDEIDAEEVETYLKAISKRETGPEGLEDDVDKLFIEGATEVDNYEDDEVTTPHDTSKNWSQYKSFTGGWVEGYSQEGSLYYYNINTKKSSWQLPVGAIAIENAVDNSPMTKKYSVTNYRERIPHIYRTGEVVEPPKKVYSLPEPIGVQHPRPRELPIPATAEVQEFSKAEGMVRQLSLLKSQDKWQIAFQKAMECIANEKTRFQTTKTDLFHKLSLRTETRLGIFVDDVKFLQRTLKKELQDLEASERDLRRLYEDDNANIILAEKLSFILEGIEKLRGASTSRFDGALKQMDKFHSDWALIVSELTQVGLIFDETVDSNLDQCKLACEHIMKVFSSEQLKYSAQVKASEMAALRKSLSRKFISDNWDTQQYRVGPQKAQLARYRDKEKILLYERWESLSENLQEDLRTGFSDEQETIYERYMTEISFPVWVDIEEEYIKPEEELAMSFMLNQVEMESALAADYDSITEASKTTSSDIRDDLVAYVEHENYLFLKDGSWFNKHREAVKRHGTALSTTLQKLKTSVSDGYKELLSRIDALDFDVEQSAENELAEGHLDNPDDEEHEDANEVIDRFHGNYRANHMLADAFDSSTAPPQMSPTKTKSTKSYYGVHDTDISMDE